MTLIRNLEVSRYRGLESFSLEPGKINVFVGRNNTGKSSVLEAVTIIAASSSGYLDALGTDILEKFAERRNWALKCFTKIGYDECVITAYIPNEIKLGIKYLAKGFPADSQDKILALVQNRASKLAARRFGFRGSDRSETELETREREHRLMKEQTSLSC